MSRVPNIGKGLCQGTARLLVKPVQAVIELGALRDVLTATLNCVHNANRTGPDDDFLAVAFPQMKKGRKAMRSGHEIELIGSETALARFEAMDGLMTLRRRGMIESLEMSETSIDPGATGAAYVRDRVVEKSTPGWARRAAARAARRGHVPAARHMPAHRDPEGEALVLFYGRSVVRVREVVGSVVDAPLVVSTYGFSSPSAPAILPVFPDSARMIIDAA